MAQEGAELRGVRSLRSGVLLMLVVPLLVFVAMAVAMLVAWPRFAFAVYHAGPAHLYYGFGYASAAAVLAGAATVIVLAVVALALAVVALARLREGFRALSAAGKGGRAGDVGVVLVVVGLLLALLGAAAFVVAPLAFFLELVAWAVAIIGYILVGIGIFEVGEAFNNSTTKIGGILTAIPVPIVTFVGLVISYVGLGEVEASLRR